MGMARTLFHKSQSQGSRESRSKSIRELLLAAIYSPFMRRRLTAVAVSL